jgi:hypothetical protein
MDLDSPVIGICNSYYIFSILRRMKYLPILLLLTSCISGQVRVALFPESRELYVSKIFLRSNQHTVNICYKDTVKIFLSRHTLHIEGHATKLTLREVHLLSSFPTLYQGVSNTGMYNTLYMYDYNGHTHIQITPNPKGFMKEILQDEFIYILSTNNLCKHTQPFK